MHVHIPDPGTGYHVAPLERSWSLRSAPARECSRHPCRITGIQRELPSATYLERFHPSVSVRGSNCNCLQKFASAIARLGWYRRAQRSSRIRNTIDRFLVAQQNHACTSIHARNYSTLKIFRVFNFRRSAISTKINYGENFPIYGMNGSSICLAS